MGRRNSPPFDDPNSQLALPGQSSGVGGKYGASPDVRNAVMDYYKSDKKDTTANLSALLSTVRTQHGISLPTTPLNPVSMSVSVSVRPNLPALTRAARNARRAHRGPRALGTMTTAVAVVAVRA